MGTIAGQEEREAWRHDALCAHYPSANPWFSFDAETQALAKSMCQKCPVINDCLFYAIEMKEENGIWGGMTAKERKKLIKELRAA